MNIAEKLDKNSKDLDELIDLYILYVMQGYQHIFKNFMISKPKDMRFIALFALEKFPILCHRYTRIHFKSKYNPYIKYWKEILADDVINLWNKYEEDPEYVEILSRPYELLNGLKKTYNNPPEYSFDLRLAFGIIETVMIIEGI